MAHQVALSLILSCAVFSLVAGRTQLHMHDCGTSPTLSLTSVFMEADEIPFGKDVEFSVTGSTKEDITGGTYVVTVARKFFGRRLVMLSMRGSVCEFLEGFEDCTVKGKSTVTLHITETVPPLVLRGVYYVKAVVMDPEGKQIACFDMEVPIKNTRMQLPA